MWAHSLRHRVQPKAACGTCHVPTTLLDGKSSGTSEVALGEGAAHRQTRPVGHAPGDPSPAACRAPGPGEVARRKARACTAARWLKAVPRWTCSASWRIRTRAGCSPRDRAWGWRAARGWRRSPGACPNWPICRWAAPSPSAVRWCWTTAGASCRLGARGRGARRALHPAGRGGGDGRMNTAPLLAVRDLVKHYELPRERCCSRAARRGARGVRFEMQPAAAWAWSANRARASRRWRGW